MDFEKKLGRLEEIVQKMEKGELALEESLRLFEEGVKLSRECHQRLNEAETKVKLLMSVGPDGKPVVSDFTPEEKLILDLALQLEKEISLRTQTVDRAVEAYLSEISLPQVDAMLELRKSMLYSATNGGKRFRPVLSILVAELFGATAERVLPFSIAVEMIHTYSLIHDDLPCMDNDDIRRGKPTNHKVFGEDFALLAGDALLTEAFFLLADKYGDTNYLAATLAKLLSEAAGIRGMVGGQAIDLRAGKKRFTLEELTQLHLLKTGALIRVAVEGAAIIVGAKPSQIESLRKFGEGLGLAFQVADDVLDHGEKDQDARSFTGILGLESTKDYLRTLSSEIRGELKKVSAHTALLEYLIDFNQNRSH